MRHSATARSVRRSRRGVRPLTPSRSTWNYGEESETQWSRGKMNIVFAGVGGQGSVLATAIVAAAARRAGHAVVTSEVHGMAQRGGTVTTAVRYGTGVLA